MVHIASCIGNIVSRFSSKYENNEGTSILFRIADDHYLTPDLFQQNVEKF
jgi:hypothetical protein